ncbi:MAG: flagellar motor switch phosphatase FliY [Lachnospiraceae bacterium]|nr:flagellar motor switch phosphatase FliY [Lachnospiraceae bacterium]
MDGMLSQDEINALLSGTMPIAEEASPAEGAKASIDESLLTMEERDAIGEIANISMGSSATTLYALVNRKVNITTPQVSLANWDTVIEDYERPCVFIQIKYTAGLTGSNIMILKETDVKVITDLMMGGDGSNIDDEIGELHLSAISEAMNQMMGASATSLSTMLDEMIDISPPEASRIDLMQHVDGGEIAAFLSGIFVKITFRMQIGELVDSTIMQLYPLDFARNLYETFILSQGGVGGSEPEPPIETQAPPPMAAAPAMEMPQMQMPQMQMPQMEMPQMQMPQMQMQMPQMQMQMPQMQMPQMEMPQMQMPQMQMPQMQMQNPAMMGSPMMGTPMSIQPAQFQNFSVDYSSVPGAENIELIMDVPLEVTVELGRCVKSISEILEFAPGTIIELDKIAGEPIDVLVNGKFVAKGEVVVIEESFGVRVTEIIK